MTQTLYNDYLQHQGVKGMKWGVRKSASTSGGSKPRKVKYTDSQIREARARVFSERSALFKNMTKGQKLSVAILGESSSALPKSYLKNPDRQIAFRMTKAEKVIHGAAMIATMGQTLPVTLGTAYGLRLARKSDGSDD